MLYTFAQILLNTKKFTLISHQVSCIIIKNYIAVSPSFGILYDENLCLPCLMYNSRTFNQGPNFAPYSGPWIWGPNLGSLEGP